MVLDGVTAVIGPLSDVLREIRDAHLSLHFIVWCIAAYRGMVCIWLCNLVSLGANDGAKVGFSITTTGSRCYKFLP